MRNKGFILLALSAGLSQAGLYASAETDIIQTEESMFINAYSAAQANPADARKGLQDFLERYPRSVYSDRAMAMLGTACSKAGDYSEALVWFSNVDMDNLSESDFDQATLYYAVALLEKGQYDEALVKLSILREKKCYASELKYYTAYLDYCQGNLDKAEDGFKACLDEKGFEERSLLYLTEISIRRQKFEEALKLVDILLEEAGDPAIELEAERLSGESWYGLESWSQADEMLTSYVLSAGDVRPMDLYELGMANYFLGDYERAIEYLSKMPDEQDAMLQNAILYTGLANLVIGNTDAARLSFEQASNMDFDSSVTEQALYNYAMLIQESSFSPFNESVTSWERFINEFPESEFAEKAASNLVESYLSTSSYEAALASIAKIKNPSGKILSAKQQLLYRRGTELYAGADYPEAQKCMTGVTQLALYNQQLASEAYFWRAESYFRSGSYREAAADYSKCRSTSKDKSSSTYGMSLYGLGYTSYRLSDWNSAISQFSEFISMRSSLKPDNAVLSDAYMRVGDCNFYKKDYDAAYSNYGQAMKIQPSSGDYALYRMAMAKGLQQDYASKAQLLQRLTVDYPQSDYVVQALYEQGRAYMQQEKTDDAIKSFSSIVSDWPQTDLGRRAAAEIASAYYQTDRTEQAIEAYKNVVSKYPGSEEAKLALQDLRSIYVENGQIDSYAAFVAGLGSEAPMQAAEMDSLSYVSAERQFSRGNTAQAKTAFLKYLEQYPTGVYAVNSHYYLGRIFQDADDYDKALSHYMVAAENEHSRYSTEALRLASAFAFDKGKYETACDNYLRLLDRTADGEIRREALTRAVISSFKEQDYETVLMYADLALDLRLDAAMQNEMNYCKAKALLAGNTKADAEKPLKTLSADARTEYGAESSYLLAQLYYDLGRYDDAQTAAMAFIKGGSPHAYWLARTFIVLSDVYVKQDKLVEAKQYLLSLRQNYKEKDDIESMIDSRLEKLN